jgi:rfaE bifunctional protein kinase chain/domain
VTDVERGVKLLPDFSKARLLVVGDVMLDRYWFGEVSRISPEAPVPVVKIERTEERPGGAANVARNATALGARVTLLSVVGDDEAGARLRELIESEHVTACLHKDPSIPTTVKLRVIGRQQQLLRVDFETQPSHEALADKLADFELLLADCNVLILSDYGKGGLAHIAQMIGRARAAKKMILVDPKGDDYSRYHGASIVTPNRAELRDVVGRWKDEDDMTARAQALRRELDAAALLVTLSEEGMNLYQESGVLHEDARPQELADVTGAGDTVIATLEAMLASGAALPEAMHVANRAAGIVVGKLGTAVAYRDELQAALSQD